VPWPPRQPLWVGPSAHVGGDLTIPKTNTRQFSNRDNLIRKQWRGDKECKLWSSEESADHLTFQCPMSKFMWNVIKDSLNWNRALNNLRDFNDHFLLEGGHKKNGVMFYLLGAGCWNG
jgi:hypothetical protein